MLNLDDVESEQKQKLENICNFLMNEVKFSTKDGDITRKGQDFLCSHCHNLCWTVFTYYDKSKLWVPHNNILERLHITKDTPKEVLYRKTDMCGGDDGIVWGFYSPKDITEEQLYVFCTFWDIPFDLLETAPQVIIQDDDDFVVQGVDKRITNYYINQVDIQVSH